MARAMPAAPPNRRIGRATTSNSSGPGWFMSTLELIDADDHVPSSGWLRRQHVAPAQFHQGVVADRLVAAADAADGREHDHEADGRGDDLPAPPPHSRDRHVVEAVVVAPQSTPLMSHPGRADEHRRLLSEEQHAHGACGPAADRRGSRRIPNRSVSTIGHEVVEPVRLEVGDQFGAQRRRTARARASVRGSYEATSTDPVVGPPRVDEPAGRQDHLGGRLARRDDPVLGHRDVPRFVHPTSKPARSSSLTSPKPWLPKK